MYLIEEFLSSFSLCLCKMNRHGSGGLIHSVRNSNHHFLILSGGFCMVLRRFIITDNDDNNNSNNDNNHPTSLMST